MTRRRMFYATLWFVARFLVSAPLSAAIMVFVRAYGMDFDADSRMFVYFTTALAYWRCSIRMVFETIPVLVALAAMTYAVFQQLFVAELKAESKDLEDPLADMPSTLTIRSLTEEDMTDIRRRSREDDLCVIVHGENAEAIPLHVVCPPAPIAIATECQPRAAAPSRDHLRLVPRPVSDAYAEWLSHFQFEYTPSYEERHRMRMLLS